MSVQLLEIEVDRRVRELLPAILESVLRRSEQCDRSLTCQKNKTRLTYVDKKITFHRYKKSLEYHDYEGVGHTERYIKYQEEIKKLREIYYGTKCSCYSCRGRGSGSQE